MSRDIKLPGRAKEPDIRLAKQIRSCRTDKEIVQVMKRVYLKGFADGANAAVVDDTDRFLRIKTDTDYEVICPSCGETLVIDLMDLLQRNGEE